MLLSLSGVDAVMGMIRTIGPSESLDRVSTTSALRKVGKKIERTSAESIFSRTLSTSIVKSLSINFARLPTRQIRTD